MTCQNMPADWSYAKGEGAAEDAWDRPVRGRRVGRSYRAIAFEEGQDLFWVWIGSHDKYMRVIGR